jgi:hypothetical protein
MTEQKNKGGRPAVDGPTQRTPIRLSQQQRKIAVMAATKAGKEPSIAAGIKYLLAQYAAQQAAQS